MLTPNLMFILLSFFQPIPADGLANITSIDPGRLEDLIVPIPSGMHFLRTLVYTRVTYPRLGYEILL